jgi:hypothetical protein
LSETDINLPLLGVTNYIRNVQAENIIASEPPNKFLQVKSWSVSLYGFSRINPRMVSLIWPIESLLCRLEFPVPFSIKQGREGLKDGSGMDFRRNSAIEFAQNA